MPGKSEPLPGEPAKETAAEETIEYNETPVLQRTDGNPVRDRFCSRPPLLLSTLRYRSRSRFPQPRSCDVLYARCANIEEIEAVERFKNSLERCKDSFER
ncbi:hypothetical protein N7540_008997 [Penicillium herquei]|nr:hypothetical protein N7540_008997 [Penicillium herquei]